MSLAALGWICVFASLSPTELTVLFMGNGLQGGAVGVVATASSPQDDEGRLGSDGETVEALVAELSAAVKSTETERPTAVVGFLVARYPDCEKGEQADIRKVLARLLNARKKEEDVLLCVALIEALGGVGKDGEKAALKLLGDNKRMRQPTLHGAALESLGRHANVKHIKRIGKGLFHEEIPVVAGACAGLGHLVRAKANYRKLAVEQLIRGYSAAGRFVPGGFRGATFPVQNVKDRKRLETLSPHFDKALTRLTGTRVGAARQWEAWWSKNKKAKWPEVEDEER